MAFCNSCGATLNPDAKFCNKCGAAAPPGAPPATVPAATPTGGSSTLKLILIVIGVIILIGILGMVTCGVVVHRALKNARVSQNGDHVKVETPFGSMETSADPEQVAKELGVDIYPGAEVQKSGASSMTFGSIHTVTAIFASDDPLDKVCDFYKSKFPNAVTTSSDQNHCTIVSNDQKNMVTVNVQPIGDHTKFQITNVTKKASAE